jgi:hypothetical protein
MAMMLGNRALPQAPTPPPPPPESGLGSTFLTAPVTGGKLAGPPGYAEDEQLPASAAQLRMRSALQEEKQPAGAKDRDQALFDALERRREIERLRPVPKERGI